MAFIRPCPDVVCLLQRFCGPLYSFVLSPTPLVGWMACRKGVDWLICLNEHVSPSASVNLEYTPPPKF